MIEVNRYGSDSAREVFQNKVDLLKMDNNRVKDEYLWKHLNTFFGVYELSLRAIDMDVTRVREAFALCGDELKKTDPGKYIRCLIPRLSKIAIGAPVPDFTAKTPEEEEISLYGIKAKFKLLDCWSSTCAMSRVEIKLIIPVYGKYKSRGFEILGLSFDKSYDKWVDMIRKDGSPWRQVSDLKGMQSPLADVYGVCELPSNLLLDENNKVIARNISGGQLDKMLSDYFMNK